MVDLETSTRRRRRCGLMVLASLGMLGCGACQPGEPALEPSVHAAASPTGGASPPSSSSVTPVTVCGCIVPVPIPVG